MSCKNKSARTEIISLKKPSALDKLLERVPKPKGAVPNFGLPKWKAIPLESKIPMVPGPKDAYNFSRQKLGKKLLIGSSDTEFNLSDPCNYEIKLQYEGFHDQYLTEFYKRPINMQRMIKLGFVTENLDAKCSVKDYNMYRKYLKKLHNDSVKKELRREDELFIERKVITHAEENAKRDLERLRKNRTTENSMERAERRNKMRERRLKSKIQKFTDRIKLIEKTRREDFRKRIETNKEKMEKMRQIRDMAAKLKRRKLIEKIMDRKRKECERMKMRKNRLKKEEKERKQFIEDRWQKKQQLQIQELDREGFLKRCIEQERQMFIQEYNKKIEKERRRMQNLLKKAKKFVKCYSARYVSEGKRRTCCKIPKCCEEEIKEPNSELKDSETIQSEISQVSSKNPERTNAGEEKRGEKLKIRAEKIRTKKWKKQPREKKIIPTPENDESIESEEFETI